MKGMVRLLGGVALVATIALATAADNTRAQQTGGSSSTDVAAQTGGAVNPFRQAAPATQAAPADPQQAAAASLLAARQALSVGDLPQAQAHLSRVQQLGVALPAATDSPQRIAEDIEQLAQLNELKQAPGSEASWRSNYARFLLRQADTLVASKDLETASRSLREATQLDPQVNAGGLTAQTVAERIELVRSGKPLAPAAQSPPNIAAAKQKTQELLIASRQAWEAGNLQEAERLAAEAAAVGVPEGQFAPQEDRPTTLARDLTIARLEGGVQPAAASAPAELSLQQAPPAPGSVNPAQFEFGDGVQPLPYVESEELATPLPTDLSDAQQLVEAGEAALKSGDRAGALEAFKAAYQQRQQLDLLTQQRVQSHLQMLSAGNAATRAAAPGADGGDLMESATSGQLVLSRQISAEVGRKQSEAARIRERDPNRALEILREARQAIENADLQPGTQNQLLRRVDLSLAETEKYIRDHKSELELDATNQAILDEVDRERVVKVQVQQKVAELVNEFNKLLDEHRYAEAEIVANRLYEMAPDELVAQQINLQAKMIRREMWNRDIIDITEKGVAEDQLLVRQMAGSALVDGNKNGFTYPEEWDELIKSRQSSDSLTDRRTQKELEIEQKLKTDVLPKYDEAPLTQVIDDLGQLAGVNIYLDPLGMSQEGVRSDTPISLSLSSEISLKSALQLILEPLHLTFTIKNEVLKVTSEQIAAGEVIQRVYDVADLVIPIPNFVPTNAMGLQGLINDAYAVQAGGGFGMGAMGGGPMAVVAGTRPGQVAGPLAGGVMGNAWGGVPGGAGVGGGMGGMTAGPGGPPAGGAANADFDSLIDLIVSTVEYDSWMENGTGQGEIQPFPTNLSLVISQTQPVHEQIADLLEQLRRLQDLQVTIEVRYIRLSDSFFERIGVDFDFNIEDGSGLSTNPNRPDALIPGQSYEPAGRASATVGLDPGSTGVTPAFTVDLDVPFRQDSFGLTAPQFGDFDPQSAASFGFAILSDIEAYFVINAAQGDRRTNVLQAPKVTLFNGQQGIVTDSQFRPFVVSVVPVVGDFAAAQQPIIVVLSEGTMLSVQAVVSNDRKYVRLTLVPFFSTIGDVQEFTFEGSETTSVASGSSSTTDADQNPTSESEDLARTVTRSGTTVQLPTQQIISVSTTVSVPDGGTVLLGGIKRLQEGRNEFGVPLLSKIPYVDRLFRNVGIGRDTDSLMMMVTPHIIIQEEEEERLGYNPTD